MRVRLSMPPEQTGRGHSPFVFADAHLMITLVNLCRAHQVGCILIGVFRLHECDPCTFSFS